MNINKYSTTRLLNFTLIFTVVLGIVNLISVNTAVGIECFPDSSATRSTDSKAAEESGTNVISTKSVTENELNVLNQCFEKKIDSSIVTIKEDFQTELNKSENILDNKNKKNSLKNSLIFIDLPILATLLLLWFFTQNKQQKQIKELTKNQNKIISKFNQLSELDNKLSNLDRTSRQIIEKIQDSNQKNIDSEVRLHELISKQQINQPINHHSNIGLRSNNDSNVPNSHSSPPEQLSCQSNKSNFNSVAVVDNIPQFVEVYNRNKYFLSDEVIATLAETQKSLNQKHLSNSNTIILENTTKKKYWIIEEDNIHYLIPHAKIKIDEYNIKNLESLFECVSFHSEYSDFQLVEPAIVFSSNGETWQLEKQGKIKFI